LTDNPRHITPEGLKKLQAELDRLWREERPRVTAMVSAAAAEGDRSENAEYIYGKKRLREIDARIHTLSKLIDSLIVVEQQDRGEKIFFGAWVTVEDDDGKQATYRIVGPDESDSRQGMISSQSPMAKALIGKKQGDWVTVRRPAGETELAVIQVSYQPPES
jgi:transcription elongation factor GreB